MTDSNYVLGRGVTRLARGRENRTTSVVSFRLSDEEMDFLSMIAEQEGKSYSQVIRDAIKQMRSRELTKTGWGGHMSIVNGASFTFGEWRDMWGTSEKATEVPTRINEQPRIPMDEETNRWEYALAS